jgi:hypothetical protein
MNEQHLAAKIRPALDAGLHLAPATLARLKVARERALDGHVVGAVLPVVAGREAALRLGGPIGPWAQVVLSVGCLVVALGGVHFWHESRLAAAANAQITEEIVEVDTSVLTGDLPIKAYLDEDFQAWLKQSSE